MTFLSETLPVALAVGLSLSAALLLSRSLLHLLFGAMRRIGTERRLGPAPEQG